LGHRDLLQNLLSSISPSLSMMVVGMKDFDLISYHISTGIYEEILTLLRFVKSPPYLYFLNLMIMIYYLIAFPNDDECLIKWLLIALRMIFAKC
jgi:hypothetical protein